MSETGNRFLTGSQNTDGRPSASGEVDPGSILDRFTSRTFNCHAFCFTNFLVKCNHKPTHASIYGSGGAVYLQWEYRLCEAALVKRAIEMCPSKRRNIIYTLHKDSFVVTYRHIIKYDVERKALSPRVLSISCQCIYVINKSLLYENVVR